MHLTSFFYRKRGAGSTPQYAMNDVLSKVGDITNEFILFGHAFAWCDTTTGIYNFGKIDVFRKLEQSKELQKLARSFYQDDVSREEIGNNSIKIFEAIFSSSVGKQSLPQIKLSKYENMVRSNRKSVDPACMPLLQEQLLSRSPGLAPDASLVEA